MILADVRDDAYNVVLVLHIISVLVAFAPASINPVLAAWVEKDEGEQGLVRFSKYAHRGGRMIHFPALVVAGVFGGALIGMSKTNGNLVWEFSQTWVWLGILVWLALCGVVTGVILPGERKAAGGDLSAKTTIERGGQIATLLLVIQLYLMVFKPGL